MRPNNFLVISFAFLLILLSGCVTQELCTPERLNGSYTGDSNTDQKLELDYNGRYQEQRYQLVANAQAGSATTWARDEGTWYVKDTFVILHPDDVKSVDRWMLIENGLTGIRLRACIEANVVYTFQPNKSLHDVPPADIPDSGR